MKTFYSISSVLSKSGEERYTKLFKKYNLDYSYKAFETNNLDGTLKTLRQDSHFSGVSISMPFKRDILKYLDNKDPLVDTFGICNTVVNVDNKLHGYNCDYHGAKYIYSLIKPYQTVSILGNGAIGSMFKFLLGTRATVYSRSLGNWHLRYNRADVLINCTSLGTSTLESPFEILPEFDFVVDMAVKSSSNLEIQCYENAIGYVTGYEFYKRQFAEQFKTYTGIQIGVDEI